MALLFIYLFMALSVSFLCSVMEAVLLSTPVSYLRSLLTGAKKGAERLLRLKQNIDKPLSAILSLNTVAHTVGAAGVGAQAVKVFGEVYFGLVSAVLTILILVITEIIPKTIGARYYRRLVSVSGSIIRGMVIITYPLVVISAMITRVISGGKSELSVSREEISVLAHIGTEEGIFGEKENKIIQNLIRLKGIRVSEIMTPRVVVSAANELMSLDEFPESKELLRFSRIPVFSEHEENVTGYIFRQEVFEKLAEGAAGMKLKDIRRKIVIIPYSMPLFSVWEKLLDEKEHIALIVDEYGGMDGIVTMEDIIESLLGFEIVDEKDTITDMRQYARERWRLKQEKYNYFGDIAKNQE
ncbi:CNNM domain-containing protein [Lentimicrobium sp.]|uniref:CNNM domain-containing protein n=1 Tax=Lentimicrobium sp. TaxID=2034841 RepID=UPI00345EDEC3